MRIGFDVSQTGATKAGCGYFAHALAEALPEVGQGNRFDFYPSFGDFFFDPRMPLLGPYDGAAVHYGPRHLTRDGAAGFWLADDLEQALGAPDIVHANNFWCPLQLRQSRLVYTLYDLAFLADPSWTTEENRIGCFDGVFRAALAADWIVAISRASAAHFLEVFPHFPAERVRVIHPCSRFRDAEHAGSRPAALAMVEPGGFWLCVGTIEPRKNQRRLAEAYAAYLARGGAPMPLVFAGGEGWRMHDFPRQLAELGVADRVLMTGYVSDQELVWLYRNCYANLYPSLFEGFGLPVLEGMQFGAATLTSDRTSLPEVAGEAALLLPATEVAAWTEALLRLAADPQLREGLQQRARARAAQFDRRQAARDLLALYAEALAAPKRETPCHAR
jgi:glycosyltransferase involved in cell wall biosynthesis